MKLNLRLNSEKIKEATRVKVMKSSNSASFEIDRFNIQSGECDKLDTEASYLETGLAKTLRAAFAGLPHAPATYLAA